MANKRYEYGINGTKYRQERLKLGQVGQLLAAIGDDMEIVLDWSAMRIASTLADRLPKVMAAVLIPEGQTPGEKDIDAIAGEFAEHMDIETAVEVIADFLSLNRASSMFQSMTRIKNEFLANRAKKAQPKNSQSLSAGSAGEMQVAAGKSSGT